MIEFTGRVGVDGRALAGPVEGWIRQLGASPPSYEGEMTLPRELGLALAQTARVFRLDIDGGPSLDVALRSFDLATGTARFYVAGIPRQGPPPE